VKAFEGALSTSSLEKLVLYPEFIHSVIVKIKKEILKRLEG